MWYPPGGQADTAMQKTNDCCNRHTAAGETPRETRLRPSPYPRGRDNIQGCARPGAGVPRRMSSLEEAGCVSLALLLVDRDLPGSSPTSPAPPRCPAWVWLAVTRLDSRAGQW